MFSCDHGSIAENGPSPGDLGAPRPVEVYRICSSVVVFFRVRISGCFRLPRLPGSCAGLP